VGFLKTFEFINVSTEIDLIASDGECVGISSLTLTKFNGGIQEGLDSDVLPCLGKKVKLLNLSGVESNHMVSLTGSVTFERKAKSRFFVQPPYDLISLRSVNNNLTFRGDNDTLIDVVKSSLSPILPPLNIPFPKSLWTSSLSSSSFTSFTSSSSVSSPDSSSSPTSSKSSEREGSKSEVALIGVDPLSSSVSEVFNQKENFLNDELELSGHNQRSSLSRTPPSRVEELV